MILLAGSAVIIYETKDVLDYFFSMFYGGKLTPISRLGCLHAYIFHFEVFYMKQK